MTDAWIEVCDGRILRVGEPPYPRRPATCELGDVTVLPGLIDAHLHINQYSDRRATDTPSQAALARGLVELSRQTVAEPDACERVRHSNEFAHG